MDKQSIISLIVPVIKRNKHRLTVVLASRFSTAKLCSSMGTRY